MPGEAPAHPRALPARAGILPVLALLVALPAGCAPTTPVQSDPPDRQPRADQPLYRTSSFELGPDGLPIALAAGESEDVWVATEFGSSLYQVAVGGDVRAVEVPIRYSTRYPFLEKDAKQTGKPQSERIVRDSRGRLWFPQTGHWLNFTLPEDAPNYSRIVSYDPQNESFCIFPVPDHNAAVLGVAWDEARNLLWFTQSGNDAVVAFNPDELRACDTYTNYRWNFNSEGRATRPFPIEYCKTPGQRACMRKYPLRGSGGLLNQLVVKQPGEPDAGSVWFTLFLAGEVGRLDPETGEHEKFPLHRVSRPPESDFPFHFTRVHQIHSHPLDGDLVFSANGYGEVIRFDIQRYLGEPAACSELDDDGENPCMQVMRVPVYDERAGKVTTHSMAFDGFGNLWVSTWATDCPMDLPRPGLAIVDPLWRHMIFLDPARPGTESPAAREQPARGIACDENGLPAFAYKGVAVDAAGGVWFTDYFQRLVHRLEFPGDGERNPYDLLCGDDCPHGADD